MAPMRGTVRIPSSKHLDDEYEEKPEIDWYSCKIPPEHKGAYMSSRMSSDTVGSTLRFQ